jgi:hypothetical protein
MIDELVNEEEGRTKSYKMKVQCEKRYTIDVYDQLMPKVGTFRPSNEPVRVHSNHNISSNTNKRIQESINKNDMIIILESVDMIYAFFQNCYHLKDWIKADKPQLKREVENLFKESNKDPDVLCMKVCADLCNGSKHCRIDPKFYPPKIDKDTDVKEIITKSHFNITDRSFKFSISYNVQADNHNFDALELAKHCIDRWKLFMNDNSLPID